MAEIDQDKIREIVIQVVRSLREQGDLPAAPTQPRRPVARAAVEDGLFDDVDEAVKAAQEAQRKLMELGLEGRKRIIQAIRDAALENSEMLAQMAVEETQMGRFEHKVMKNRNSALYTPGIEDIIPQVQTGDDGMTLVEYMPFGVINAICPITNPTSTVINNGICMISAGNSIVFSPHPGAKNCTIKTMTILNQAILSAGGPPNLMVAMREPSLRLAKQIMDHPDVSMLVATGGGSVVRAALSSGKKAIAAGPGNPPVVVDETADVAKAARDITEGSFFDNNLLCIGEKSVFVVESVAVELIKGMIENGCYLLEGRELEAVESLVIQEGHPVREYIGKDASYILERAGIRTGREIKVLIFETHPDHPIVVEEFLMPIVPIVRTRDFKEAVEMAVKTEAGNQHTAIIHSRDLSRITEFAKAIQTTVLVVNGPSYACAGVEGEGFVAMTIAGPTGEGFTKPSTFTRERRVTLVKGVSINTLL
jgi:propionaldehyde dehydrogenase